jgi:hypothetical protein
MFWVANIYPKRIDPYLGCYQQAWPFQVDLQIHIFIPFLAIIYWKYPLIGFLGCLNMILINVVVNMYYTYHYDLKIEFLQATNYYLLQAIISKPWTKLQNVAQGLMLARFYMRLLKYRKD